MRNWNPYPFFRLIIPFILGILAGIYPVIPFEPIRVWLIVLLVIIAVPIAALYKSGTWRNRWLAGVFIKLFVGVAGFAFVNFNTPKYDTKNISKIGTDYNQYVVRITEPLTEKANSYKGVGEFVYAIDTSNLIEVTGNLLIYFEKDTSIQQITYGDYLLVNARVSVVEPPGNPHQFNYKKFLSNSGIYHQVYLKSGKWKKTGNRRVNPVFQFAYEARFSLLQVLEKNGLKGDEFAVVSAILLGYDDFMDRELREKYAGAGALHVLCVSGLHVGIIFLLLSFILKPLDRKTKLRYLKVILILISIWAYAFITGLSPSVMRAAVMFSLFAFREASREKSNPYNILAASAFILLLINPFMITKIGFQLSYAAVLAIISLFNPIYGLLPVKNPILDYFWKLSVVSLAAQIGTFPLAIYYFHQFPVYFFLTNIIVIPLVWLILNAGILVLVMSIFSGMVSSMLGLALSIMLLVLNSSVGFINILPGATLTGLVIDFGQVVFIYSIIILLNRSIISKSTPRLMVTAGLLMFLSVSLLMRRIEIIQQKEMIVYQTKGQTGIDFIRSKNAAFIADSALLADPQSKSFNITGNRVYKGIREVHEFDIEKNQNTDVVLPSVPVSFYNPYFFRFCDKRLAVVGAGHEMVNLENPVSLDVLILRENPRYSISEMKKRFNFETVIFDPSVSYWLAKDWKIFCDSTGQNYHDVGAEGYFRWAFE